MAEPTSTVDPDSVMSRVFTFVDREGLGGVQYTSDVYLRHRATTKRSIPVVRYIPGMFRLERGENDYLSECHLRLQYHKPSELDCKVLGFYTTQRHLRSTQMSELRHFNFSIYEPDLFTDRALNPFNRRNRSFYHYRYLYTSHSDSFTVYRLYIKPRFNNDRLVEGTADIDVCTGAVRSFSLAFRYRLKHLMLTARMGKEGYEALLPLYTRLVSDFHLLGNRVVEVYELNASHTFTCPLDTNVSHHHHPSLDQTSRYLLRIDTTHIHTDRAYFNQLRPFPLRANERSILTKYDSVKLRRSIERAFPAEPDTMAKRRAFFNDATENLLLDSHTFRWGKNATKGRLRLPAIFTPSMAQWSGAKGFSLQTRVDINVLFSDTKALSARPSIGYSFKQKQAYWRIPIRFDCLPKYDGTFTTELGGGNLLYASKQADEVRNRLHGITSYDSLVSVLNAFGFNYYRDGYFQTDFALTPISGLRFTLGTRFHRRTLTNWNTIAGDVGIIRQLRSMAPRLVVEYTPRQYFYRDGKRRVPLYYHWPTFVFDAERGYAIGKGNTSYERFETDIRYRLSFYALRALYFRWGGGMYTRRGKDCFIDYEYFRFNNMPQGWNDNLMGEFQLLSSHWYNESRYYFRACTMYESPMLLFSRIKPLSSVVQRERMYCNLLSVRSLPIYTELGYAVSTHLCETAAFMSVAPDRSLGFGIKFLLKFFED